MKITTTYKTFLASRIWVSIILCTLCNYYNVYECQALQQSSSLIAKRPSLQQSSLSTLLATTTTIISSSSSPIPPPPSLSVPVWSLATCNNMNIVTYAMPVSIGPPKLWAMSLFKNTLSQKLFCTSGKGILQLLQKDQYPLIPILGKQSGKDIDKAQACADAGWKWASIMDNDNKILPGCSLYLEMEMVPTQPMLDADDHWVVLCQVTNTGQWNNVDDSTLQWNTMDAPMNNPMDGINDNVLYSGWLRQEGYL